MAFVLGVDDDAESREIVARYLQKAGHRVHGAPNGNKALDALVQQTPDVVILAGTKCRSWMEFRFSR